MAYNAAIAVGAQNNNLPTFYKTPQISSPQPEPPKSDFKFDENYYAPQAPLSASALEEKLAKQKLRNDKEREDKINLQDNDNLDLNIGLDLEMEDLEYLIE